MRPVQTAAFGVPEYEPRPASEYRPRLSERQSRGLRRLKRRTGKPMSALVAEALDHYLQQWEGR